MSRRLSWLGFGLCIISLGLLTNIGRAQVVTVNSGVDTILAEFGLNGADTPHGGPGDNPEGDRWEWDGSDGGGQNQGLLWMDIPQNALNGFSGIAWLGLHINDNGNAAAMHRITSNWLTGPDSGDEVTWNSMPNGPGVIPGDNAVDTASATFPDSIGRAGQVIYVDVTADVAEWAGGQPNYGWGFIGQGGDGTGITSFESPTDPVPTLLLINQPGIFPAAPLGGPAGSAGNWGVIDYFGEFTATEPAPVVVQQVVQIQNGQLAAQSAAANVPILDIADPDTNPDGGPDLSGTPIPYPSNNLTSTAPEDDDMISVAHGTIRVKEPGQYTFNIHTDDGFAMRIFGGEFSEITGNGSLDFRSADTVYHASNTGDSDTQVVIDLQARDYDVEFVTWERGGGAYYELSAAKGNFVTPVDDKRAQWLAVGDPRVLEERIETLSGEGVGQLTRPLEIYNIDFTATDGLELAREDLIQAIEDGTTTASSNNGSIFIIDDHTDAPTGCPFGAFPRGDDFIQFPNTAGDRNNFATAIYGAFVVDDGDETPGETIEVSIHVDSDDRSMFRVIGNSFIDILGDSGEFWDIDGDEVMWADVDVCNTNFTGLIELTEGQEYEFEALHVENGGDAGMQVLFAAGDQLADPDPTAFSPLVLAGVGVTLARNVGFELVAPGGGGVAGDFNGNGVLDAADIDDLTGQVALGNNPAAYDLNGDAVVNSADINVWIEDLFGSWVGDANLDGEFNSGDLVGVLASGTYETGEPSVWSTGDFTGDGVTTSGDLVAALAGGGYENGPRGAVAAVPEPTSSLLVLLGLIGVAMGAGRRR